MEIGCGLRAAMADMPALPWEVRVKGWIVAELLQEVELQYRRFAAVVKSGIMVVVDFDPIWIKEGRVKYPLPPPD